MSSHPHGSPGGPTPSLVTLFPPPLDAYFYLTPLSNFLCGRAAAEFSYMDSHILLCFSRAVLEIWPCRYGTIPQSKAALLKTIPALGLQWMRHFLLLSTRGCCVHVYRKCSARTCECTHLKSLACTATQDKTYVCTYTYMCSVHGQAPSHHHIHNTHLHHLDRYACARQNLCTQTYS